MEWDGMRCHHHTSQSYMLLKTYELFLSGIFHLIFLDHDDCRKLQLKKAKTTDKSRPPYLSSVTLGLSILIFILFISLPVA
jgi:hypothetical protein